MEYLLRLKEQGKDPQALRDRPEVSDGYLDLLVHYSRLSKTRTYGMNGPNPIDFISILHYNQAIAHLDLEFFIDVIQLLDSAVLEKSSKAEEKIAIGSAL